MGRPRKFNRASEILSIRVPIGTKDIISSGFRTINRLSASRDDPAIQILRAQQERIAELKHKEPVLAKAALDALEHVLSVLDRVDRIDSP